MGSGNGNGLRFPIEEHRLDNGLRVVLQPDRSAPLVTVHLMYHVGSRNERPGRTGFAHLFEHLLFQGSEHVEEDAHFRHIQNAGGTLNGSTWFDRTNYYETLPSHRLDLGLWLESDRMGWFLPAITQAKLDNQREVVKNERRQSYENRPYGLAFETALRLAYPEGHPYRHPTIGYMEDLDAADLEDVRDFFRTWYVPNNAVLVLAGDFEPAEALRAVDRWFGEIPAGSPPPEPEALPPVPAGERRETIDDRVQVPRVYMLFHGPDFRDPRFETADVLAALLADGQSSRLHRELIYERRVAGEVYSFAWPTERVGMLWVIVTGRPGVDAASLEAAVDGCLEGLLRSPPEDGEVEGAVNRARRQLVSELSGVGGRADALAHAAVLRGDPEAVNEAFDRYGAVTPADVAEVAAATLRPGRRAVVRVVPRDEAS